MQKYGKVLNLNFLLKNINRNIKSKIGKDELGVMRIWKNIFYHLIKGQQVQEQFYLINKERLYILSQKEFTQYFPQARLGRT